MASRWLVHGGETTTERCKLLFVMADMSSSRMHCRKHCYAPCCVLQDQAEEAFQADAGYWVKSTAEQSKAEDIANMLSQDITTQHLLFVSLGSAEYMEFVLKNPSNVPQTVTILSDDPELTWVKFRRKLQTCSYLRFYITPDHKSCWENASPEYQLGFHWALH